MRLSFGNLEEANEDLPVPEDTAETMVAKVAGHASVAHGPPCIAHASFEHIVPRSEGTHRLDGISRLRNVTGRTRLLRQRLQEDDPGDEEVEQVDRVRGPSDQEERNADACGDGPAHVEQDLAGDRNLRNRGFLAVY